jgi:hypothetical protein
MQIGDKIEISGQTFKCVDYSPHITADGREQTYLVMRTRCPECGSRVDFTATRTSIIRCKGGLVRRCQLHKRPGLPVDRRRSSKRAQDHRAAMARVRMQMRRLRDANWMN